MFPWQKKELPAAQTKAAADSAFGLPEEPQCPAVEALVGAGEAGSLAKWWGWAAGSDGYSSAVIGERVKEKGRKGSKPGQGGTAFAFAAMNT